MQKHWPSLVALSTVLFFAFQSQAFAEEKAWFSSLGIGKVFSQHTLVSASYQGTSLVSKGDSASGGSILITGEAIYRPKDEWYGLSIFSEYNRYTYSDQSTDSQLGIYVMPKVRLNLDFAEFWLGGAAGLMLTTVDSFFTLMSVGGTTYSFTGGGTTSASFVTSPRIGGDFKISDQVYIGAYFAWVFTTASTSATLTNLSNSAKASIDYDVSQRQWTAGGINVTYQF